MQSRLRMSELRRTSFSPISLRSQVIKWVELSLKSISKVQTVICCKSVTRSSFLGSALRKSLPWVRLLLELEKWRRVSRNAQASTTQEMFRRRYMIWADNHSSGCRNSLISKWNQVTWVRKRKRSLIKSESAGNRFLPSLIQALTYKGSCSQG